jgi:hypothetical protein
VRLTTACACCDYVDPHEEKQKALLQRITGSVARLHEVLKEINTQIEVGLHCGVLAPKKVAN